MKRKWKLKDNQVKWLKKKMKWMKAKWMKIWKKANVKRNEENNEK